MNRRQVAQGCRCGGGNEGNHGEEEVHDGNDCGRELQQYNQDCDDIPQRTRSEDCGGHGQLRLLLTSVFGRSWGANIDH